MEYFVSLKDINNIRSLTDSFITGIIVADDDFSSSSNLGLSIAEVDRAIAEINALGLKSVVKVDRLYEEQELDQMVDYLKHMAAAGAYGVIYTDVAVKMAIQLNEIPLKDIYAPETLLTNYRDIDVFRKEGTSGCVISKDIPLEDVYQIIENVQNYCFLRIHGPILIAYSRRRYISGYLNTEDEYRNGYYLQELKRTNHLPIVEKSSGSWLYGDTLESTANICDLAKSQLAGMIIDNAMLDDEYTLAVVRIYDELLKGVIDPETALNEIRILNEDVSYLALDDVRKTILNKEENPNG